jgi:hypothetical protein
LNMFAFQADRLAKAALRDEINSSHTEACTEHAIIRRRRPSALNVAEDAHAHVFSRKQRNGITQRIADGHSARHVFDFGRQLTPSATTTMVKRFP